MINRNRSPIYLQNSRTGWGYMKLMDYILNPFEAFPQTPYLHICNRLKKTTKTWNPKEINNHEAWIDGFPNEIEQKCESMESKIKLPGHESMTVLSNGPSGNREGERAYISEFDESNNHHNSNQINTQPNIKHMHK